jgi:hypothetical protein
MMGAINPEYLAGEPCDTNQTIWSSTVMGDPELSPTGDFARDLGQLLRNRSPQTGQRIRVSDGPISTVTICVDAPKCCSVMTELFEDQRLEAAGVEGVELNFRLAGRLSAPRGRCPDPSKPCALAAGATIQRLSANDLPHQHAHEVYLSIQRDPENGRYMAADLSLVAKSAELMQAAFQGVLAYRSAQAGYRVERRGNSFSFAGFPQGLVDRFSTGPWGGEGRHRPTKRTPGRPAAQYKVIQAAWLAGLDEEETRLLLSLRHHRPAPPAPTHFHSAVEAIVRDALAQEYWVRGDWVAAEAVRRTFGECLPDLNRIARLTLGEPDLPGDRLRVFAVAGRSCFARAEGLADERVVLDTLRATTMAQSGWIDRSPAGDRWAQLLCADRHPVAVLPLPGRSTWDGRRFALGPVRAALGQCRWISPEACEGFEPEAGRDVVVEDAALVPSRMLAKVILGQLKTGGRALLVRDHSGRSSLWLDCLARDAGVAVLAPGRLVETADVRLASPHAAIKVGLAVGSVAEVAVRPGSLVLCSAGSVAALTAKLRKRRGTGQRGRHVVATALVPWNHTPRPGLYLQFRRNHRSFRSNEVLEILSCEQDGLLVRRVHLGLRARVELPDLASADIYKPVQIEVAKGERLRLTRTVVLPDGRELRQGRRLIVRAIKQPNTLVFADGTMLQGPAHWEYDYCQAIQGPLARGRFVVCDAADVRQAIQAGWGQPRHTLVVCGATRAEAGRALRRAVRDCRELPTELGDEIPLGQELASPGAPEPAPSEPGPGLAGLL